MSKDISEKRKDELDMGFPPENEEERIWVEYRKIHRDMLKRKGLLP